MLTIKKCKLKVTPDGIFIPKDGFQGDPPVGVWDSDIEVEGLEEGKTVWELFDDLGFNDVHRCGITVR